MNENRVGHLISLQCPSKIWGISLSKSDLLHRL